MELKELINKVKEFHKVFKLEESQNYKISGAKCSLLRYKLMEEENNEYNNACVQEDEVEIADALGDQLYVLLGTIISHGLEDKIEEIFTEIHRSNMTKLDKDGNPVYKPNGKVGKSELFEEPNIEAILNK